MGHTAELNADVVAANIRLAAANIRLAAAADADAADAAAAAAAADADADADANAAAADDDDADADAAAKDGKISGLTSDEISISDAISDDLRASSPELEEYPHGAVGAHVAPRVFCVSLGGPNTNPNPSPSPSPDPIPSPKLGEGYGVLCFNGIVIEGGLAAVVKALLEWTKVSGQG